MIKIGHCEDRGRYQHSEKKTQKVSVVIPQLMNRFKRGLGVIFLLFLSFEIFENYFTCEVYHSFYLETLQAEIFGKKISVT